MTNAPTLNAPTAGCRTTVKDARLLVVDDNPVNRDRLAERLRGAGYAVETAADGPEALGRIRGDSFELALVDTLLPGMTGEEILQAIKQDGALSELSVIMVAGPDEVEGMAHAIELGAEGYLSSPFDPVLLIAQIDACLENRRLRRQQQLYLRQLEKEKAHSQRLVNVVIPMGISLAREPDFNALLEKILMESKTLCHADGGTLYLRTAEKTLRFVMLRNDSLDIAKGGTSGEPIPFPPLALHDPVTGEPNHGQVACHVALTGASVNIPDAYHVEGFDFKGTKEFDQRTGYRSTSFLTVPLKDQNDSVIGVLQLINAKDPDTGDILAFDPSMQQAVESLSRLAAAALESYEQVHRQSAV